MAPAWSLDPRLPAVWAEGGIGIGENSGGGVGAHGSLELLVAWRPADLIAVRDFGYRGTDSGRVPREWLHEDAVLYGRKSQTGHALAFAAVGAGWVEGVAREHVAPHPSDAPLPVPWSSVRYRALALSAEAQAIWAWRFGAVGVALRADATPVAVTGGAELTISFGLLSHVPLESP